MPIHHLQLDSTLGAAYVGNIVAAVLYGMTNVQTFIFFKNSERDRWPLKLIVAVLWILDSLQIALVSHGLYFYSVTSFNNILALLTPTWSILAQIFVTCASDLLVRYVFGRRVWRLSGKSKLLAISIIALALYGAGSGIAYGIEAFKVGKFKQSFRISWLFYSSLVAAVVCDSIIAGSLCATLLRSRTGYKRTDSLLNVLMLYSINTTLITSLSAIICFITYAVMPNRYYYVGIFFVLSKLNVNCLLACLNARNPLRNQIGLTPPNSSSGTKESTLVDESQLPSAPSRLAIRIDMITEKKKEDSYKPLHPQSRSSSLPTSISSHCESPASPYGQIAVKPHGHVHR